MPIYSYNITVVDGNIRYSEFICALNKEDAALFAELDADRKSDNPSCRFTPKLPVEVTEVVV